MTDEPDKIPDQDIQYETIKSFEKLWERETFDFFMKRKIITSEISWNTFLSLEGNIQNETYENPVQLTKPDIPTTAIIIP